VEPTGRIDDDRVQSARAGCIDRIKGHRCGISTRRPGNARNAKPVGPYLELGNGPRPIGISSRKENRAALPLQPVGELGGRRGFSGTVYPNQKNDCRRRLRPGYRARIARRFQHLGQTLLKRALEVGLGLQLATPDFVLQRSGQFNRGCDTEIGLDEDPL
jgi:hypothetical protein